MAADDGVTYIIVVQETPGEAVSTAGLLRCAVTCPVARRAHLLCSRGIVDRQHHCTPTPRPSCCTAARAAAAAAKCAVRAPRQRVLRLGHHRLGLLHRVSSRHWLWAGGCWLGGELGRSVCVQMRMHLAAKHRGGLQLTCPGLRWPLAPVQSGQPRGLPVLYLHELLGSRALHPALCPGALRDDGGVGCCRCCCAAAAVHGGGDGTCWFQPGCFNLAGAGRW